MNGLYDITGDKEGDLMIVMCIVLSRDQTWMRGEGRWFDNVL